VRLRSTCAALIAAAALAAAGCGGDDNKQSSSSGGTAAEFKAPTIPTDLTKKPAIPKTDGLPPEKLVVKDVVPGKGKAATAGAKVQVKYVGVSYSTDKEFDTNWKAGAEPFDATLAEGPTGVIKGWIQGIPGMKEGGRRLLVVPPDLAYGVQGSPPAIAPYETLVFVIDLKKVG
jgi:peptidylprolyl isomerase